MSAWYHTYIKNSTTFDFIYMSGSVDAVTIFGKGHWNRAPHDIPSQLGAPNTDQYAFDCSGTDGCSGNVTFAIVDQDDQRVGKLMLTWTVRMIGTCSASASVDSDKVRITRDDYDVVGAQEVVHHIEVKQGI